MTIGAPRKKVTIRDVANAAGVSTATVSRAFARPGRVGAETAERIRRVADELGYRANTVDAAQLPSPDELNGMLAITVADISNPVFSDVVKAAQHRCLAKGFGLAVIDAEETGAIERGAMQLMHRHVDGFILASSRASDAAIRKIAEIKPVVTLNRPTRGIPAIIADSTRGLITAVERLIALGHRQITYLAGPASSWQDGMRWRVLNTLSVQHGFLLRRLPCASPTMAGGFGAFRLFRSRPTSAVIAYNDLMAVGFLSALTEHGIAVPGEVSVVGIDNLPTDTIARPTLSSVDLPRRELGEQAVDELVSRLRHVTRKPSLEPVMLPSTFVQRDSIGPVANTEP